jgi:hypothetical protein
MRTNHTIRVGLEILAVVFVLCGLATMAWAQAGTIPGSPAAPGTGAPPMERGEGGWPVGVLLALGVLAIIVGLAKFVDLKRKGEDDAVYLEAHIADALLRERSLANLPVAPTVHIPLWTRSPATIQMHGQVPSPQLQQAALRVAEREAARIRSDFRIEDRIAVVPSEAARAA